MPVIMSAKAFKKHIYNTHNIEITLPPNVEKVILKNDSIITTKVPENWTLIQFKEYLKKFVKQYVYDEEASKRAIEQAISRNTEESKQARRGKSNKSNRKSLTLSSDES